MNNIPEKSNRLIGFWALVLVFSMMLSLLLAGCGDSGDNSSEAPSAESSVSEASSAADETSDSASDDPSDESDESYEDSSESDESSVIESSEDESPAPETSNDESSQTETPSDPDDNIIGAGTKDDPYLASLSEDLKIKTVSIPAGKTVYYSIYRIGGTILTINSKNISVTYNGEKYTPKSGKIVINIESALASASVDFEIKNTGSNAERFTLSFEYPKGTYDNPEKVSKITDKNTISLEEEDSYGYNYRYVAEKKGFIRFYMTATADSILIVTNNRNSAQRTTESDPQTDDNGNTYVEIEVEKGDVLIINVAAIPNKRGKIPASKITWNGEYN